MENERNEKLVMYLIVNDQLGMSPGKIAAQCGHAVMHLMEIYFKSILLQDIDTPLVNTHKKLANDYEEWRREAIKVVLKAGPEEWKALKSEADVIVIDAGYTEIAPNSETVLGFYLMKKSERSEILKRLKTL